jgi:hypothetical protein
MQLLGHRLSQMKTACGVPACVNAGMVAASSPGSAVGDWSGARSGISSPVARRVAPPAATNGGSIRLMPKDGEESEGVAREDGKDSVAADPPASEEAQAGLEAVGQTGQQVDSDEAQVTRWRPHWYIAVASRYHRWRDRMPISELHRTMLHDSEQWRQFDERDNNDTRLPSNEEIHLGGLVLVEAFTPSTASRLRKSLEALPESYRRKSEWISGLEKGRSATDSGGWQGLGSVRRPGSFGFDSFDSEIPDAVDAISPKIFYLTPSLTVLVATFTIRDDEADLSELMRADYASTFSDPIIHVPGRLSWIRKRNPASAKGRAKQDARVSGFDLQARGGMSPLV